MTEYLSKKAVLEYTKQNAAIFFDLESYHDFRNAVLSGAFDVDTSEIQRLRAALVKARAVMEDELLEQLHAQIKYYFGVDGGLAKLQDGVNKLLQERQRLIDGLLTIMDIASEDGVHWKLDRCYTMARDILKEIGVLSK